MGQKNILDNLCAIENEDYVGFNIILNGNNVQDFTLSIDFAKHLSMMARSKTGKKIYNYFIEVQKRSNQQQNNTELIKIQERDGQQVVSARELYKKLGFDISQWSRWYKKNILDNLFAIKGQDYVQLDIMSRTQDILQLPLSGKTIDFALSIDFAKHLSMIARTKTGKDIYNYFNNILEHSKYKANSNSIELIKIQERNGQQAVSARELHQFLESKQEFSNWIKNRIKQYDLIENIDFIRLPDQTNFDLINLSNQNKKRGGDRRSIEYALSISAAKELAMVENNYRGKQARRYFIEVEKRAKEALLQNDFQAMCERRGIKHEDIQHFFTLVDNYIPRPWRPTCKRDIAPLDVTKVVEECNYQRKDLCIEDIDVAEWMKMSGYAKERDGYCFPTQDSLFEGWIDVNEVNFYGKKENMVFGLPYITPKGVMYFASLVIEYKIRQNIEQNPHIFFK